MTDSSPSLEVPLHIFRFKVEFQEASIDEAVGSAVNLVDGYFSEVSGLDATMEPKTIQVGGMNYGVVQRPGRVSFATVILRRGITTRRHLWQWFELMNVSGAYKHRLQVTITLQDHSGEAQLKWTLERAMPIRFKSPDLNAMTGDDVGIEEIHLAHEGLRYEVVG
ncbi:MAG: phage tail protein [Chloroflexia bacterium]|nr:phage tail protein [Chloroflexia bacterium]